VIAYDEDGWDACLDRGHTRDFSRQWRLWELGKLGDPTLVYGARPENSLEELLACTGLTTGDLRSIRILPGVLAIPRIRSPRSFEPAVAPARGARVPSRPGVPPKRLRRALRKRPPRDLRRDLAVLDEPASS